MKTIPHMEDKARASGSTEEGAGGGGGEPS